jgi:hypothetical protein
MTKLIVEMEMPIGCANCTMADDDSRFCKATKKYIPMLCKPSWCPIKGELPDEHGDLIDRDALLKHVYTMKAPIGAEVTIVDACYITHAEAVIAAERKDDGTTAD